MFDMATPGARVPCFYDLRWNPGQRSIEIDCHPAFWEYLASTIRPESPLVEWHIEEFKFRSFASASDSKFGFDGAWSVRNGVEPWYRTVRARIPRVETLSKSPCSNCDGTGDRGMPYPGDECIWCRGSGRERRMRMPLAYAHSATWTVFTRLAEMFLYERFENGQGFDSPFPQLITVETITKRDTHGGSLGGRYAAPVRDFLAEYPKRATVEPMEEAMYRSYQRMVGLYLRRRYDFRASLPYGNGWLNVDCPGNACGLHPAHGAEYDMNHGMGYEFHCHNVDTPVQQLTLLSGLAALNTLLRERNVGM